MDPDEREQLNRVVDHEVKGHFPAGAVQDDGSQAAEQLSPREIVARALELLRANYVFPGQAERAAAAIEARLAAGEYDNLDEIALTELVTRHLQEATDDRHLALMLGEVPPPRCPTCPAPVTWTGRSTC